MWDLAFLQDRDVAPPGAVLKSRAIAHADEGQDGAAITLHDQLVGHLQGGSGRTTFFRRMINFLSLGVHVGIPPSDSEVVASSRLASNASSSSSARTRQSQCAYFGLLGHRVRHR